ncbi:class C beta-lactamase-related serine hydrolase [Corallococcus sp. AB032C]|nr:class C beta-lactamase-related serine hydrolase [Corallococcus sp. AB032C]
MGHPEQVADDAHGCCRAPATQGPVLVACPVTPVGAPQGRYNRLHETHTTETCAGQASFLHPPSPYRGFTMPTVPWQRLAAVRRFRLILFFVLMGTSTALAAPMDLPHAASPEAEGIDPEALSQLVRRAKETKSTGLVVLKNGKLVGEWSFGSGPSHVEAMSITKSIAGLAVLKLLADGKIPSLDQPVHHYFPEWNQGRKKDITLRHLLTHTSGLQTARTTEEIYASPDFVKLALAAELDQAPGSTFRYNNKAVNLLAAIVRKASGQRLDQYLRQAIFNPLGITRFGWSLDGAGNPQVMSGLQLQPLDLAKLGQLMLEEGMWQRCRVLPAEWVRRATQGGEGPAAHTGLLWWPMRIWQRYWVDDALLTSWRKAGVSPAFIQAVSALKGRVFTSPEEYLAALKALRPDGSLVSLLDTEVENRGVPPSAREGGPLVAFNANGFLGQYLVVVPSLRLVVVRMYAPPQDAALSPTPGGPTDFGDFFTRVKALEKQGARVGPSTPTSSARGVRTAR